MIGLLCLSSMFPSPAALDVHAVRRARTHRARAARAALAEIAPDDRPWWEGLEFCTSNHECGAGEWCECELLRLRYCCKPARPDRRAAA